MGHSDSPKFGFLPAGRQSIFGADCPPKIYLPGGSFGVAGDPLVRLALSKPRRRYVKTVMLIAIVALPLYVVGNLIREPFMFDVGLALMIFVLTLLGNVLFQTWWVEEKEGK